jgi:glycosyltransferase involved in cell wall biosynthesis
MRVLVILNRIPLPLTDGGAICSYNTVKFLHAAGHDLTVLALNTNKHYHDPLGMADVCAEIQTLDINTDISTLKAAQNLFFSRRPYIAERFHNRAFADLIVETLMNAEAAGAPFDVVHIDHTTIAWYADAIRERVSHPPPLILRTHNIEHIIQERLAAHEAHPAKRWYRQFLAHRMKRYEREYWNKFDGVIAITPEEAAIMRDLGCRVTLDVVPAGVDVAEFAPHPDAKPLANTICYIGGMDWEPNIEAVQWFVETVFPYVQQRSANEHLPALQVHIAGKRMPPYLQRYAECEGVNMHPDVPSAADFLRAHEILVVPLLSGGGMRLKIVEAMALGIPIVSTRVGAEGVAVQHGESIMFADTPEEFQTAIYALRTTPELKERIIRNAREIALREYSWESVATRLERLYERVIAAKKQ